MTEYYDDLETRDPETRESEQLKALSDHIARAKETAPAIAKLLKDVDPSEVTSREALARLPIIRKADLVELQKSDEAFGGFAPSNGGTINRIFMSPGPIFEPMGRTKDWWRMGRALFAAGFRKGDIVHNTFAYHLTPAGAMFENAADAVGCTVFPAGTGNTEMQVEAIGRIRPTGYSGVPDFLKVLLDKAEEMGIDASSITKALVGGAALPPSLRNEFDGRGIAVLQSYGTADLGLIAYESEARDGMILDEGVIVEIVRPGTGDPVPEGEVGEVVVTPFNPDYPLVRFATGDLSAIMPGQSPCGRTAPRIKGWMGRADQTTKVKGMFVHPGQVVAAAKHHSEIGKFRLVVTREGESDAMTLQCEVETPDQALAEKIAQSLQTATKLKGRVAFAKPGSLPNDGKIIADDRRYDEG